MSKHNIISFNQLASWKESEDQLNHTDDMINNYFECLIDCDDGTETSCRQVCSELLR